jgi:endonuclease/exonuclease/phosphatase family metal-dependent hydrolase
MCRFHWLITSLLLSWMTPGPVGADEPISVRVLCYNIHHGEGTDGKVDLERLAKLISTAKPDLVALQEVDDKTGRTGGVDQTAELARLTGLTGRFAYQIDYDGGRYGQAILSRHPISDVAIHLLPGMPDREQRIAGSAEVEIHGRKLIFATTHLHHADESIRVLQAEKLNEIFVQSEVFRDRSVVITGDFNAVPTSQPIRILEQHWTSATRGNLDFPTFPAVKPARQLDYLFFRPADQFSVSSAKVIDESVVSDHRPVLIELKLR